MPANMGGMPPLRQTGRLGRGMAWLSCAGDLERAAMLPALAHVDTWIFDLDNTLYPARADLFGHIDRRMTQFVAELLGLERDAAWRLQKDYFLEHGTTLAGLMAEHKVDPHAFLAYVHDIEMDALEANAPLAAAIARLPGRKLVFTNGDKPYALKVLDRLGLGESFEAVHDIHAMDLVPKPDPSAYAGLCRAFDIAPSRALFVEDMARNLKPAKAIGMTTVWVDNGSEQHHDADRTYVDFVTDDITTWLETALETR
jgi:putative hydrolase of the HAD superfamily